MTRIQLGRQQTEGMDRGEIQPVRHGHQQRAHGGIEIMQGRVFTGIYRDDTAVFQHHFRLEVAQLIQLVRNSIPFPSGGEDGDGGTTADVHSLDREAVRPTTAVNKGIVTDRQAAAGAATVAGAHTFDDGFHQGLGHGNFMDGILRQGDSNGIANAVGHEGANADGALDAAIFTIASFRHTEVDGVIPVAAQVIEMGHQQSVGLDHDLRIAGLHREQEIVETIRAGDAGKFQGALHHAMRGVTMAVHDAVTQAAMIGTDAHGAAQPFALFHQRDELRLHVGHFLGILFVRVFLHGEFLFVSVVARIDADFFHPFDGLHGGIGLEMNVGHQGHIAPSCTQAIANVLEVFRNDTCLRRDTHDFAAHRRQFQGLLDAGLRIARIARQHGLHPDRVAAANAYISHRDQTRFAALIMVEVGAVTEQAGGSHRRWGDTKLQAGVSAIGNKVTSQPDAGPQAAISARWKGLSFCCRR